MLQHVTFVPVKELHGSEVFSFGVDDVGNVLKL